MLDGIAAHAYDCVMTTDSTIAPTASARLDAAQLEDNASTRDWSRRQGLLFIGVLLGGLLSIGAMVFAYQAIWNNQVQQMAERTSDALALFASDLRLKLVEHRAIPKLFAEHPSIAAALEDPSEARISTANRLLEAAETGLEVSDIYVMDTSGLTLAASNWRRERTFVGRNFSFRPYFRDAADGRLGQFYGLGTTSGKRGFYYAAPVWRAGRITGVVAVKIALDPLETLWAGEGALLVTDEMGVIFLTNDPSLLYRSLNRLAPDQRAVLARTRRYSEEEITPLGIGFRPFDAPNARLAMRIASSDAAGTLFAKDTEWLVVSRTLPELGGTANVAVPTTHATGPAAVFTFIAGLALASVWLIMLAVVQRRRNILQRAAFERSRRETLEQSARELERRVTQRTSELSDANEALRLEISERKRMESSLRRTQGALAQAEKLAALGTIAAEINHELNQPIGAVRSYADNARAFLDRGKPEKAIENLEVIASLTERMGAIVTELKSFARQDTAMPEAVPLKATIEAAARTVRHRLNDLEIELGGMDQLSDRFVSANHLGLEQVLTNLLSNAADALAGEPAPRHLSVSVEDDGDVVSLTIADNGPGIPDTAIDHLFDPFFTTKSAGEGLGLGLAISRTIVTGFGGSLEAENRPQSIGGGAAFTLTLPHWREER